MLQKTEPTGLISQQRNETDLGTFAGGVHSWDTMIASALPRLRPDVFRNACKEGSSFVAEGAPRAAIADALLERAERHKLVSQLGGVAAVEAMIADAFAAAETVENVSGAEDDHLIEHLPEPNVLPLKGWLYTVAPGAAGGKIMELDRHGRPAKGRLSASLSRAITEHNIDVVSLDPFVKTHSVEENSNSMIDDVVQVLADLAVKHNIAVDVLHHTSKGPADPGNANRGRGASAMKDAARLVYTLSPMTPQEGQAFGVDEVERRRVIRLDSAKVNIAAPMTEAKWFKLVSVNIGNGTGIYPDGDDVQTVEPWSPPDNVADLSKPILNHILVDLEAGLPDGNRYSDAPNVAERAAWRVVEKYCPGKHEAACRQIIRIWVKSGLLIRRSYDNPTTRKSVNGLYIDSQKLPS